MTNVEEKQYKTKNIFIIWTVLKTTHFLHNLQMDTISLSVCSLQTFPAYFNVLGSFVSC
jgi:hypothetical protein